VEKLGASIGDHLLPEQQVIIKNSFEGSKVPDDREDIGVKAILSVLIPRRCSRPWAVYDLSDSEDEDD
jgi:hypothetical protein